MMRSRPAFPFIVVAALVLGAWSSGDSSKGDPTEPIPTAGRSPGKADMSVSAAMIAKDRR